MATPPELTPDEIDDLLYYTRVNEAAELQQTLSELTQKYQCQPRDILQAGLDPESGNTVLHYCSANGFADLLPKLLSGSGQSQDPSMRNGEVLSSSILNQGNKQGNTPLHWAAYNGHLAVVKLLVNAGADMWIKNGAGHLAMFEAERAEKEDVVLYLLQAGRGTAGAEGEYVAEEFADSEGRESNSVTLGPEDADVNMDEAAAHG